MIDGKRALDDLFFAAERLHQAAQEFSRARDVFFDAVVELETTPLTEKEREAWVEQYLAKKSHPHSSGPTS